MLRRGLYLVMLLLVGISYAVGQIDHAAQSAKAMQGWYDPATGLYKDIGWWNAANSITALVDFSRISHSTEYSPIFLSTFVKAQNKFPGYLNDYYDDEGWWALAWIDAYDATGDKAYLSMAESIFTDMAAAWDDTCNGGIWWSRERKYKNAIANELFLSVAAHLATRVPAKKADYLAWANKEWTWFAATGMVNGKGLVNDGLTIDPATKACKNNDGNAWSYNQGVVLGGVAELSKLNPDLALPAAARKIAASAITLLVDKDGVMHDLCEPKCGGDGSQFKGIFARNLGEFNKAFPDASYGRFLETNANAIWEKDRGNNGALGVVWSGPPLAIDAATTTSGLDALIAASALTRR